jgi:hypothetical protein
MIEYNPMSKEFKDECSRLGLSGYQLTIKYKKEGKCLEKGIYIKNTISTPRKCCNNMSHNTCINSEGCEQWYKHKCQKMMCTEYLCRSCWLKYDPNGHNNIIHSLRDRRTKNLKDLRHIFGDNILELACILYGWDDLNKKYDDYRTPIDCYDPKTGLYHQVQGRHYNSKSNQWPFNGFEDEWDKTFETMVCFCISKDGNTVERIYRFLLKDIIENERTGAYICKNPTNAHGNLIVSCYEEYREKNEDELKSANRIWARILEENKNR